MSKIQYTEQDYNQLSWHDIMIHGLSFDVDVDAFRSDIIFDIDYIVEWLCESESCSFRISPAYLTFHNVTDFKMVIDWGDSGFQNAVFGIFILDIERQVVEKPRYKNYFQWNLKLSNKRNKITFGASGFTLEIRKEPIISREQFLNKEQRQST